MADDDEVRELIERLSAAQRQGFPRALRFYLAARTWLAKPHADPHDDAPRKAAARAHGGRLAVAQVTLT